MSITNVFNVDQNRSLSFVAAKGIARPSPSGVKKGFVGHLLASWLAAGWLAARLAGWLAAGWLAGHQDSCHS